MTAVVALGGNALMRPGERGTAAEQRANLREACTALRPLLDERELVITHGNGPQVGNLLIDAGDCLRAKRTPRPSALEIDRIDRRGLRVGGEEELRVEPRTPCLLLDLLVARVEQTHVTAKFVDDEATDERRILVRLRNEGAISDEVLRELERAHLRSLALARSEPEVLARRAERAAASTGQGASLAVSSRSTHPKDAADFIKFLTRPEAKAAWAAKGFKPF